MKCPECGCEMEHVCGEFFCPNCDGLGNDDLDKTMSEESWIQGEGPDVEGNR
jgi:hypothetical protein